MDVGLLRHEGLHTIDASMHEWSVDQNWFRQQFTVHLALSQTLIYNS